MKFSIETIATSNIEWSFFSDFCPPKDLWFFFIYNFVCGWRIEIQHVKYENKKMNGDVKIFLHFLYIFVCLFWIIDDYFTTYKFEIFRFCVCWCFFKNIDQDG